jgi:hypothetical protein
MARHLFKTNFGQCRCLWCHKLRHSHGECEVTEHMRYALKLFAQENGRNWKAKLLDAWERGLVLSPIDGFDILQPLWAFRNNQFLGPRRLANLPARLLKRVESPYAA